MHTGDINVMLRVEEDCRRVISVEISPGRFSIEKERVLRSLTKKVTIPGFRRGKAPLDIVRRRFAAEIEAGAIKDILPVAYGHAVSTEKLSPIGEPAFTDIRVEVDQPLRFQIELEVKPDIKMSDYRELDVPLRPVDVGEEEIGEMIGYIQERHADFVTVDRPAVTSDVVVLDYGPIGRDGTVIEKRRITDYPVQLGTGQLFPAFEAAVAGKPGGFTGTVEIEYPGDYKPEHLAGKKVTYQFTIKEVRERRVPPLNDDFASRVDAKYTSLGDLRDDVRRDISAKKGRDARREREERAIDLLIERNPFDVPRSMLERYKGLLHDEDVKRRRMMGVEREEDEGKKRQIDEYFEKVAVRNIKRHFLMEEIAAREGLVVTDEEVENELDRIAANSEKSLEEVRKLFPRGSENRSNLSDRLSERKVFGVILGDADSSEAYAAASGTGSGTKSDSGGGTDS